MENISSKTSLINIAQAAIVDQINPLNLLLQCKISVETLSEHANPFSFNWNCQYVHHANTRRARHQSL